MKKQLSAMEKVIMFVWFMLLLMYVVRVYYSVWGEGMSQDIHNMEIQIERLKIENSQLENELAHVGSLQYSITKAKEWGFGTPGPSQIINIK